MSWILSEISPRAEQPKEIKLNLKKHQLAMLKKCMTIEETGTEFAFMADKAGCGKTAVIISLILNNNIKYGIMQNLIVVPQNIIKQWSGEISKFTGDKLKVMEFVNYEDISSLYFDSSILGLYDILLTTPLYYETIITCLNENGNKIARIIYDEIDSIDSVINSIESKKNALDNLESKNRLIKKAEVKGIKNKKIWFISASLFNLIDEDNGFTFGKKTISMIELGNLIVKCDNKFINKYNDDNLANPKFIIEKCSCIMDPYSQLLSVKQLDFINSLSFQNISSKNTGICAENEKDAIKIIIKEYLINHSNTKKKIESFNKNRILSDRVRLEIVNENKNLIFFTELINRFHSIKCNENCEDMGNKLICINKNIDKIENDLDKKMLKLSKIEEIINKNTNNTFKLLIFSDFTGGFKAIYNIFEKYNISYKELSKGNIKEINEVIDLYKNDNINVLLIDSSNSGAGMNLENTTDILFLHRTNESLRNQIIGRAQRPGRTSGVLNVYNLYNENEVI